MNDALRQPTHPYQRCLVLAGGGLRWGMYAGMYAALCEADQAPDVILASCGGAMAGYAIRQCPDPLALKNWLLSPQWYAFWQGFTAGKRPQLTHALWGAAQRWADSRPAPYLADVWANTLFTPPAAWPDASLSIANQPASHHAAPSLIIVASRLLYGPPAAGQRRSDPSRPLFEETLCTTTDTQQHLSHWAHDFQAMDAPQSRASGSAIAHLIQWRTDLPLALAARMSVTDMFYFEPVAWDKGHFMGGVVDLLPIELAKRLGQEVIMERKAPFDPWLSVPAWRSVLGVCPQARLDAVHQHTGVRWIDTTDIAHALPRTYPRKRLDWRRNHLHIQAAPSLAAHQQHILAQWRYGYERTQLIKNNSKNDSKK